MRKRLKPSARRLDILSAGLALAEGCGYALVTRDQVAEVVGVTGSTVQYHFNTMCQFRRELMRFAVAQRNAAVVAQGLAARDSQAMKADVALKAAARLTLI